MRYKILIYSHIRNIAISLFCFVAIQRNDFGFFYSIIFTHCFAHVYGIVVVVSAAFSCDPFHLETEIADIENKMSIKTCKNIKWQQVKRNTIQINNSNNKIWFVLFAKQTNTNEIAMDESVRIRTHHRAHLPTTI